MAMDPTIEWYALAGLQTLFHIALAAGLSAAVGFRIFVPFTVISAAALGGHLELSPGFEWIGTYPALVVFGTATVLEIAAYYVPWLDNFLDTVATPAAIVAGAVVTASVVGDISPLLRWTLAIIAGGGIAGAVQAGTVLLRGASTVTTGGLGNPVVATMEAAGSFSLSTLTVFLPLIALSLSLVLVIWLARYPARRRRDPGIYRLEKI